ncbi:hypothetical protein RCL1_002090 [Eukaryota sp. TZLM3-RCL]
MTSASKPVTRLLVDANVLLSPDIALHTISDTVITSTVIIDEVRDAESRQNLSSGIQLALTAFEIDEPEADDMKLVSSFAEASGDIVSLSAADLRLAALAVKYAKLFCPRVLRETPSIPEINLSSFRARSQSKPPKKVVSEDGWISVGNPGKRSKSKKKSKVASQEPFINIPTPTEPIPEPTPTPSDPLSTPSDPSPNDFDIEALSDSEDDWITMETVTSSNQSKPILDVAVMTNDYALQNLLMHLNIPIISSGGKRIHSVKISCLLCTTCETPTREMTKLFCPRCGNNSLIRVGLVVGHDGVARLPRKFKFIPRLRHSIFPVPLPTTDKSVITREEQLNKAMRKVKRDKGHNHESDFPFFAGGLKPASKSSLPRIYDGKIANRKKNKK